MVNSLGVKERIVSAYNTATADVNGGPEAAAGMLLASYVAKSVAREIALLLESSSGETDINSIIEGINEWSRR